MARRHYWQFLTTEEGTPIEGATISIYEAGNNITPIYVFDGENSVTSTNVVPQVVTNERGYFEFWVADGSEANGYPNTQKMRLSWSKAGITSGYIDFVDIFTAGDGARHNETVASGSWLNDGGDYYDVVHNLGDDYPLVAVWNTDTTPDSVDTTVTIENIDANTTRIRRGSTANLEVRILV